MNANIDPEHAHVLRLFILCVDLKLVKFINYQLDVCLV